MLPSDKLNMTATTSSKKRSRACLVLAIAAWAASAPTSVAFRGSGATTRSAHPRGGGPLRAHTMWQTLDDADQQSSPARAFHTIFGGRGERGEYMDGYSARAMAGRCAEDYGWAETLSPEDLASERAEMMARLYDDEGLWEHVSMVAFAEHYIPADGEDGSGEKSVLAKPFVTFRRRRDSWPRDRPIFCGVVLSDWEARDGDGIGQKLAAYKERGIDYVRLACNFGEAKDIGGAAQLADDPLISERFRRLADAVKACQLQEMVPLVLIQVPWREPGGESKDYYERAIKAFAKASKNARVESKRLLLETRPPVGLSAREEKDLDLAARISLGLETGRKMFEIVEEAFYGDTIAGFCVAGGSTKGENPTAMEDDTQNAVRQGMRYRAKRQWGYEVCFWEMGAKLMLQPKVGQLWGDGQSGHDAALELFRANAQALSDEITEGTNQ